MKVFKTTNNIIIESEDQKYNVGQYDWDTFINRDNLAAYLRALLHNATAVSEEWFSQQVLEAPIGSQEIWAAGVTYLRSRDARMEESKDAGGGTFYDRVYEADRPELFFKSPAWRVRGPRAGIRIRRDAKWNVPEPELALCVNARGEIIGYTIGNDVSSRDIEGENPLYLPQAKVYDGSCALGPGLYVTKDPLPAETTIAIRITRAHDV